MFEHRMQKMHRLQKIFLTMQKILHEAAKITFCSLENPGSCYTGPEKCLFMQEIILFRADTAN